MTHYNDVAERCCLPGAWDWYSTGNNARLYAEPLPDQVIEVAHAAGADPHRLWDGLADDGWEMHNQGLAAEAAARAGASWKPGDPVYPRPPDHVSCACGVQVLGYGSDVPTVCPECGGPLTDARAVA